MKIEKLEHRPIYGSHAAILLELIEKINEIIDCMDSEDRLFERIKEERRSRNCCGI